MHEHEIISIPLSAELIYHDPWYCFEIIARELRHYKIREIEYRNHEDMWGQVMATFEVTR